MLGLGHIVVWVPMLVWLWPRFQTVSTESGFGRWLLAVIVLDGVSLLIDAVDVLRYAAGERTPALTLGKVDS